MSQWLCAAIVAWGMGLWGDAFNGQSPKRWVYCSAAQEQSIDLLYLDEASGQLEKIDRHPIPGEPSALASSRDRRFLFACLRSTGQLASFRIEPASGKLTAINIVEAGADPAHITIDPSGKFLLAAYYVAAKVTIHRIAEDGRLSTAPIQTIPTAEKAHAIMLDRTQRFAYVPHTGPNLIFQFAWETQQGKLSPLQPDRLQRPLNSGPRHLSWHPTLPIAYIDNEQGSSVTAYAVKIDGTLKPGNTVTTLPENFHESNSTAEIKVHPSGRYLYVSNRGHDSLAVIRLDENGTGLDFVTAEPTEKTPRSFDLDPSGNLLLAAGESNGFLAVNRIDPATGRLATLSRTHIGPRLWWVHILPP